MKRMLSTMLVFVFSLFLVGTAMAAAPKPPASLCLNAGGGGIWVLVVKPSSSIKMEDGAQKFYGIQGGIIGSVSMPLVGSGYMEGGVFHFTFNSTYNSSGTPYFIQAGGFWDVTALTGSLYAYYSFSGNHSGPLSQLPCTDYETLGTLHSQGNTGSDWDIPLK